LKTPDTAQRSMLVYFQDGLARMDTF